MAYTDLDPAKRERLSKSMAKDYLSYIKRHPRKTPKALAEMVFVGYKRWFEVASKDDLAYYNALFKDLSEVLDIDYEWDVGVVYQMKASNVFNYFIDRMKKYPATSKQDVATVTRVLNEEFDRQFRTGSSSEDIKKAFASNAQMRDIGKRLVEELSKLGYKF